MARAIPRLVLGGVSSGVGKTTTVIAIARALRARGLRVALFKCGPDYLDPTYHARAIGAASHNLDGWMMGKDAVLATFVRACEAAQADVALVEGVMGLFDGASPKGEEGSTAEIAKWLDAPVTLVVDASGMARSIAALAHGFATFDAEVKLRAVIANKVGSRGHLDLLKSALASPPILGGFPDDAEGRFPERHLGLHTADEASVPDALLDRWGARAEEWIAIDALLDVARAAPPLADPKETSEAPRATRCRIGLAHDEAFHFYYEDNLRRLEALGAELVRFSPIHDARLPEVDALILGGGYPELHAAALSANGAMRAEVARFAAQGKAIYAECGGLMYLTRAIVTRDGARHAMVGLVPAEAVMCDRLQALGYVEVETQRETLLGPPGARFRGHQFRYSELREVAPDLEGVYSLRRRRGGEVTREGFARANVLASYVHAHWASNPQVAERLVDRIARSRDGRGERGEA